MDAPSFPWPALVDAIRKLRPAVRMKWMGDDSPPPWEPWMIVSSENYLETGRIGPVPFREVEWVEIDPMRRNEGGRLVAADQKNEIASVLIASSVSFEEINGVFRVVTKAG